MQAEREMHLPRHAHTEELVSRLCTGSTWKKKCCTVNRISLLLPHKITVRNAFAPYLFASFYQVYIMSLSHL